MRVLDSCQPSMERVFSFLVQLTLMEEDDECVMLPFLVNMEIDSESQRVNGMKEADLRMKLGVLWLAEGWRHRGNCRADVGRETSSCWEFACEFCQK